MNGSKPTNRWSYAVKLGFFAGMLWGGIRIVFYFFEFSKILPAFLIEPFFKKEFMKTWSGHMVGWGVFIGFSIFAALLYAVVCHKLKGPWPGISYGVLWWGMIYLAIGPLAGMVKRIDLLDLVTILSELCLFTLWGVFIGYTLTVEFTDEKIREPKPI